MRFLKQPSTWRGITWALTLLGLALSPEQREAIALAGISIVALIETFNDEDSRAVNVKLPPIELQSRSEDDGYISRDALRSRLHVSAEDYPKEFDERESAERSGWNG